MAVDQLQRVVILVVFAWMAAVAKAPTLLAQSANPAVLDRQITELRDKGRYREAIPLAETAYEQTAAAKGEEHLDTVAQMTTLALLYRDQGRYAEAEPLLQLSLTLREAALGPNHRDVATSLNNLAELYRSQVRYAEAEPLSQRALAIREAALGPNHPDVAAVLNNQANLHRDQGRFAIAEPLYQRALKIRETVLGRDHLDVAGTLTGLAQLYRNQSRHAEAEPLFKRGLALREAALGPSHPAVGASLDNLAELHHIQGRFAEAEQLYQRALDLREAALGPDHPDVGTTLNNFANVRKDQGRYAEAEALYKRGLAVREAALGPDNPNVARSLNGLASLYLTQGLYDKAEPVYRRALAVSEKALGVGHVDNAAILSNLAVLHRLQGRNTDAEPLFRRALAIRETVLGLAHPSVAVVLNNLAGLYQNQGRNNDAEAMYKRSISVGEVALGPNHPNLATWLNNLAGLYEKRERYTDAEPLYRRALSIWETVLGPDHPDVGTALHNLAGLYRHLKRYSDAEPLLKRSSALFEKALGPNHPTFGTSLLNLGDLYREQSRFSEASPFYRRALAVREAALGRDHPQVGQALASLADLHFEQKEWAAAAEFWQRRTSLFIERGMRNVSALGSPAGQRWNETSPAVKSFAGLVKVGYRLTAAERKAAESGWAVDLPGKMFVMAQWAQSSAAAASLAQMAARGAAGNADLEAIVRERQDLVAEWQRLDAAHTAAVSRPPDKRDRAVEATSTARRAAIDARLAAIDERLKAEFPDYAALARPEPLSVAQVQADMKPDEALVFFLDTDERKPTPEETFIWVVTKTDMRWVRSEYGTPKLKSEVAALRCGLDATAGSDAACAKLTGTTYTAADANAGRPLPFDAARSHALYRALFGEVEDLIQGKHLLLVPSGPLTQLPFQVLVNRMPEGVPDHRKTAWLARDHALTVLPAVPSLKALRRVVRTSAATLPMIGFGNPLLDGDQTHPQYGAHYKRQAAFARDKQTCQKPTAWQRVAAMLPKRRGDGGAVISRGVVELAELKTASPLPETADELCAVAGDLKVAADDIRLGARATETDVKALSASGQLAKYRIVHFATHGVLAGQLAGATEPGLVLTPPTTATEADDGYLSASEIAGLKLDADWVILSACNTAGASAAGDGRSAEALSGLARAFFYAQARALLVSHWEVNSAATVKLITAAVGAISRDKSLGRAEALRRAMLAMIDNGAPNEAHPSYWAPFVVVGEGAGA
jgi:tetratricopeptide (TPR) repeat protein/CHAT domain-containing protein